MPVSFTQEARLAYLRWLAQEEQEEQRKLRLLRGYYAGEHQTVLTERQLQFLGKTRLSFRHNLCRAVIDILAERLAVQSFLAEDPAAERYAAAANGWWVLNNAAQLENELYMSALIDGQAFLLVAWDAEAEKPLWVPHLAYDGASGVKLHYDPDTGSPVFASKRWQTLRLNDGRLASGSTRLNLYFPDRIEKYVSDATGEFAELGWRRYTDAADEPWPLPWLNEDGEPLGIPVVPFSIGESELLDLIPLQDALNKIDLDLLAAADYAGFRVLWLAGVPPLTDPKTGKELPIELSPGRVLRFSAPDAKVGDVPPADLSQLILTAQYWIQALAGLSRVPQFLFQAQTGDKPSGESLRMQEIGLLSKLQRYQNLFGGGWEQALDISRRLWNLHRPGERIEFGEIGVRWKGVQMENPEQNVRLLQAKAALGVPKRQIWAELGYDEAAIERMESMIAEEERSRETLGSFLLRSFDRGGE
jgi:hypothetical protein